MSDVDHSDIGRTNTNSDEGIMLVDIFADTSVDMTGIFSETWMVASSPELPEGERFK